MTTQTLTLEEQERAAYMAGDTRTAELLAQVEELTQQSEDLSDWIDELGGKKRISADLDELDLLRQFFRDCFECLDGHYPCPSVTSDHDKAVILNASVEVRV